jgi:hypothetical protein
MKKLTYMALSLTVLASLAYADGSDNARAVMERHFMPSALAASAQVAPPAWMTQTQASTPMMQSREEKASFEAQILKDNRANYRGR